MELMNPNLSYADKCGMYRVTAAELIPARQGSGKNEYVRTSLKKVMKSGRVNPLGFSHYFNIGMKDNVAILKQLGVTEKGISEENMNAWKEAYEKGKCDMPTDFYGFFWTQQLGGVYKNNDTGKVTSETLVFIPCDEDTGLPLPEYVMTQARLQEILKNYTPVKQDTSEPSPEAEETTEGDENERAAFEEYMRQKRAQQG